MLVSNRHRTTAIVIKHDGHSVTLVPMKSGKLRADHERGNTPPHAHPCVL